MLVIFGLDSILAACFSIPPLLVARAKSTLLLIPLILGIIFAVVGSIFTVTYPLSDLVVGLIAVSAGILIGRIFRSEIRFLIFLIVLSILDVAQILLTSAANPNTGVNPVEFYGNFVVNSPFKLKLGILDLMITCAMSERWKLHGAAWWMSLLPGVLGLLAADLFVLATGKGNLALIPFLTLGYVCSERVHWALTKLKA